MIEASPRQRVLASRLLILKEQFFLINVRDRIKHYSPSRNLQPLVEECLRMANNGTNIEEKKVGYGRYPLVEQV